MNTICNKNGPEDASLGNSREDRQNRGVGTIDGYVLDSKIEVHVLTEPLP